MNQKEKFFIFIQKFCNTKNYGNVNGKVILDFGSGNGKLTEILTFDNYNNSFKKTVLDKTMEAISR